MVFEPLMKIYEEIIRLSSKKKLEKKDFFNEFYRPLFENLITIHSNYLIGLNLIKNRVKKGGSINYLKKTIEKVQLEYKPLRQQALATSNSLKERLYDKNNVQAETDFIHFLKTYMTSFYGGRTSFTGVETLLDESLRILQDGQHIDNFVLERRFKAVRYQEYFLEEIEKNELFLINKFTDLAMAYDKIRLEIYG